MTFPADPLPILVEIFVNGAWEDITSYVYSRDNGIVISRGRQNEASELEPSSCRFTLDNRDGRFSPRNPNSPYYGSLNRNTQVRVSVRQDYSLAHYPDYVSSADYFWTPDSVPLSITGDLDLRIEAELDSWRQNAGLIQKSSGGFTSWKWGIDNSELNRQLFQSSEDGTTVYTDTGLYQDRFFKGRRAYRITMDVDNGAGACVLRFYQANTIAGPWTLYYTRTINGGAFTFFDSTSFVSIGVGLQGIVYAAEIRNGIDGPVVASPDFTIQTSGATSFIDAQGNTWTKNGNAYIDDRNVRFTGEMAAWPSVSDISQVDIHTSAEAAGILRRLSANQGTLRSALYRAITGAQRIPVVYWPGEDDEDSSFVSSATGAKPMAVLGGPPEFGSYQDLEASAPLPVMKGASFSGIVPKYADTGDCQFRFFVKMPASSTDGSSLFKIRTTGTAVYWEALYSTGGSLTLKAYNEDPLSILTHGPIAFAVDGQERWVTLSLEQNGANIDYNLRMLVPEGSSTSISGTLNSRTVGVISNVRVGAPGIVDAAYGHIVVQPSVGSIWDINDAVAAYRGETAVSRILRLCDEEGINYRLFGTPQGSTEMGYQNRSTFVDLIKEAAAADGGMLLETREYGTVGYLSRESMIVPTMQLGFEHDGWLAASLTPTDDDELTTNDVTVTRTGGGSARAELLTGKMSTQNPPDGIGRYATTVQLNLANDADLEEHAGWRLLQGSIDESRYPKLSVELAHPLWASVDETTHRQIVRLDPGDRVDIRNPPPWVPPGTIRQIVQGIAETLSQFSWKLEFNTSPAAMWDGGLYDWTIDDGNEDDKARYSSDGATLGSAATSSATSLSVATASGPLWTTTAASWPFDILVGGERMTVTAVAGTSSPQTFTVARSVNGIVKAQAAGTEVTLYRPRYYAI
jgi:hypothetical protein